MQLEYNNINKR